MKRIILRFEQLGYSCHAYILGVAVMIKEDRIGQLVFKDGTAKTLQTPDVQRILNKERINMSKYTRNQLEGMTSPELVKLYNKNNPDKPVKRFADKKSAVKRTLESQPQHKLDGVITLLNFRTSMRENSKRYTCYACIKDGMSIEAYTTLCEKHGVDGKTAKAILYDFSRLNMVAL